jgi:Mrp family chromosome partitioning ATPase
MANEAFRLIDSSAGRGAEQRSDELNLRELWRAVVRRKFVLLATILVLTGATYAYISQQTPLFMAQTLIQVQTRDAQVIQVAGVIEELVADAATMQNEMQMRILLEEMGAYYDLVILDSPPVGAVSDGLTLAGIVDKSLYVIRWEQTARNVVLAGMRQMFEAGADIAGVVLSRVDVKKHARYGYADSGHYYRGN